LCAISWQKDVAVARRMYRASLIMQFGVCC
jgi:hypothetical protein